MGARARAHAVVARTPPSRTALHAVVCRSRASQQPGPLRRDALLAHPGCPAGTGASSRGMNTGLAAVRQHRVLYP
jgi:hypothetical protein